MQNLLLNAILKEYKLQKDNYLAVRVKYFIFNTDMGMNDIIEYLEWRA